MAFADRYVSILDRLAQLLGVIADLHSAMRGPQSQPLRVSLTVKFREPKRSSEYLIDYKSPQIFSSLFLNQIKVALAMRGIGHSQFNILCREDTNVLLSMAGGQLPEDLLYPSEAAYRRVYDSIFPKSHVSRIAAVKLYYADRPHVYSAVVPVAYDTAGVPTTVADILTQSALPDHSLVVSNGVALKPDTPVEFLQTRCCYADGFVHLIVSVNN